MDKQHMWELFFHVGNSEWDVFETSNKVSNYTPAANYLKITKKAASHIDKKKEKLY